MKAVQGIIVFFSLLVTQVPAFLIFRDDAFLPPFGSGKLLFLLATEVVCLMVFSLVFLDKQRIQKMSIKKFRRRGLELFAIFITSGIVYFLLLMSNVVQDNTTKERIVLPVFSSTELTTYLRTANEESRVDVLSISEEINNSGWNRFFYYVMYCIFFLLFNILFASVVFIFTFFGLKVVAVENQDVAASNPGSTPAA
jgi:hypothetical protein